MRIQLRTKCGFSCTFVDLSKPAEEIMRKLLAEFPEISSQVINHIDSGRMATVTEDDTQPIISPFLQSQCAVFQPTWFSTIYPLSCICLSDG